MAQRTKLQTAKASLILLDIDSPKLDLKRIEFVLSQLEAHIYDAKIFKSPSGQGWHVYLQFIDSVSDTSIILFQVLLGSDYKREVMNLKRVMRGDKNWNKLFQFSWKKNKQGKLFFNGRETFDKRQTNRLLKLLNKQTTGV